MVFTNDIWWYWGLSIIGFTNITANNNNNHDDDDDCNTHEEELFHAKHRLGNIQGWESPMFQLVALQMIRENQNPWGGKWDRVPIPSTAVKEVKFTPEFPKHP